MTSKNQHMALEFFMSQCYGVSKELVQKGAEYFRQSKKRGVFLSEQGLTTILNERVKTALQYIFQEGLQKLGNVELMELVQSYNPEKEVIVMICLYEKGVPTLSRFEKLNEYTCLLVEKNELRNVMEVTHKPKEQCSFCGLEEDKQKLKLCSKCLATKYCSKECQQKEWPKHKLACKNWR